MTKRKTRLLFAVFAAMGSASCATHFDPADATRIHAIAVTAKEPHYEAASYFVARKDVVTGDKGEDFDTLMARQNLRLGAELSSAVSVSLRGDGYAISADGAQADAVMEITVGGVVPTETGPTYAAHGAAFEPELTLRAKLTDAKSGKTLFNQLYIFDNNTLKPIDGTIYLQTDPKFYLSGDELFAKPEIAAAGFRSLVPLIAANIAAAMKRP